ncbi:MAG: FUSC family protein [Microthrixaceae bacterium]|nr:FUSC family protein [Microthrixaceae bacterium]
MASFDLTAIHLEDPDHSNLRKAARLALVMPSMVVLGKVVLDSAEFSTFAAFGAFGLLGLANFGGPRRVRFGLGVGFTLLGGALVGVGTLLSDNPWLSVALVAVVAFSATFVEVLGGYATAGTSVLILAAVLSVMVPAAPGSMGARVTGWLFAGLVSSLALAMLWPRRRRPRVRLELASTARTLAGFMRGADRLEAGPLDDCFTCVLDLRRDVDAAVAGPGGPRSRDQALMYVLDETGRAAVFLQELHILQRDRGLVLLPEDTVVLASAAAVLEETAELLEGSNVEPSLDHLRSLHDLEMVAVEDYLVDGRLIDEAAEEAASRPAQGGLLQRFDVLFPVRMLSYLVMSIATNSMVALGRNPSDTSFVIQDASPSLHRRRRDTVVRSRAALRNHFGPHSRWFRNALRAGVALGAATAVAEAIDLGYAFWVVLGTLSVLRSSVLDTGSSALQSILGTIGGFAVASAVILAVGDSRTALAILFPLAVFATGYFPGVVGFAAGQGAFTAMVVVLFNLSESIGWTLGLVRLERVALGVAVSVLVALVLWPRGASTGLARAVARELEAALDYLATGLGRVLHGSRSDHDHHRRAQQHAVRACAVAESEFGDYLNSRGSKRVSVDSWAPLVAQPHALMLCGDWLGTASEELPPGSGAASTTATSSASSAIERAHFAITEPLSRASRDLQAVAAGSSRSNSQGRDSPAGDDPPPDSTDAASAALSEARARLESLMRDPVAVSAVSPQQLVGLLWSVECLAFVNAIGARVGRELAQVNAAVSLSWWR